MTRRPLLSFLVLSFLACSPEGEPEVLRPGGSEGAVSAVAPGDPAVLGEGDPVAQDTGAEEPTILFLGTSLTEGLGLPDPDSAYPGVIERRLAATGRPHRVRNAGVSGDTSAGGLSRLPWLLRGRVDLLVVELGANDGLRGLPVPQLEENLREVVRTARRSVPELPILLLGMEAPPNLGERYTAEFREVFARVASQEGAAFVPFLLDGVAGYPEMNQRDGIHPTVRGHERMAETVWPHLVALMEAGR